MKNGHRDISRTLWERLGIDMPVYTGDVSTLSVPQFLTHEVVSKLVEDKLDIVETLVRNVPWIGDKQRPGDDLSLIGDRMMVIQLLSAIVQHVPNVLSGKPPAVIAAVKDEFTHAARQDERTVACQDWARAALDFLYGKREGVSLPSRASTLKKLGSRRRGHPVADPA